MTGADDGEQVLVVDDDASIRKLVATILRRGDYRVTEAASGKDALRCMASQKFDAVVLDLMMPEVSGTDVLRAISESPDRPRAIIIMSAAPAEVIAAAAAMGIDATLHKPFQYQDVLMAVRNAISIELRRRRAVNLLPLNESPAVTITEMVLGPPQGEDAEELR